MTDPAPAPKKSRAWKSMLPGIIISVVAIIVLFRFFDWHEVVEALRQAEWIFLLIALPIYLLSYILRALAWHTLLQGAAPYRKVFLTMHMGYLLNNVLPFRLGELGRAYLLGQEGIGFWRVFSTILIERAFDMILAAGLLLGTLPFVLNAPNTQNIALLVGGIVLLGLVALYLLARYRQWALVQFERLGERWPVILRLGRDQLEAFLDGLSALTSPGRFLKVLFWMIASWLLAILLQYLILRSFYPQARLLHAAFSLGVSALGVAVPSSPGYVGVYEAVIVGALSVFGIPLSVAFAHAVTAHLLYVLLTGFFGVYGLANSGVSIGQIFQQLKSLDLKR